MSIISSLTPKQVIMAMVDGLKNPRTRVLMSTYGIVDDGICYGCAAVQVILK